LSRKLHVLFSGSAAGTLRHVLDEKGSSDEVVALLDNLSYGPIASLDPQTRYQSLIDAGLADRKEWDCLPEESRRFWDRCAAADGQTVLWYSSRSPRELAGLLAYMHRFADRPCQVVDVEQLAHLLRRSDGTPWKFVTYSVGELDPDNMRALFDGARAFSAEEGASARRFWQRLAQENAMLRIPGGDGMVSAPETLMDDRLLSECTDDWTPFVRILANVLGNLPEERGFALDDVFLEWRLDRLIVDGALESRQDQTQQRSSRFWRKAWIRRAN
jgi:hypothetical protein